MLKRKTASTVLWIVIAGVALQVAFAVRVALLGMLNPSSTAVQRSEAWRLLHLGADLGKWRQRWVPFDNISPHLRRAVIASEDARFMDHFGVDWDAVRAARARNERRHALIQRLGKGARLQPARLAGGSTITQQLAKNIWLSGERTWWRKGQELLLTWQLEIWLDKRRILEIYLNVVEWGDGIFGAEAAAQHYFGKPAAQLTAIEAARLAALLPAPKRYGQHLNSRYLNDRTQTILARMGAVSVP